MKKARIALALLALGLSTGATPQPSEVLPNPFFIKLDLVERLSCEDGISGSGARIDSDKVVTAYHVIKAGVSCSIGGVPTEVIYASEKLDLAVLHAPKFTLNESRMVINCNGMGKSDQFYAVGYAFGTEFVVQRLLGTGSKRTKGDAKFGGMDVLKGNSYPGMSGGPIVNEDGEIVGIVNASMGGGVSISLSRSLADSYLCRNGVE